MKNANQHRVEGGRGIKSGLHRSIGKAGENSALGQRKESKRHNVGADASERWIRARIGP